MSPKCNASGEHGSFGCECNVVDCDTQYLFSKLIVLVVSFPCHVVWPGSHAGPPLRSQSGVSRGQSRMGDGCCATD